MVDQIDKLVSIMLYILGIQLYQKAEQNGRYFPIKASPTFIAASFPLPSSRGAGKVLETYSNPLTTNSTQSRHEV